MRRWMLVPSLIAFSALGGLLVERSEFGAAAGVLEASFPPAIEQNQSVMPTTPAGKIAEGEYAIVEQANGGAVGPFGQEVYDFRESWALWRDENDQYHVEGVRQFESPRDQLHSNQFSIELSRDLTVLRLTEFAKLNWVPNSGPLSCEFLPSELHCTSGTSTSPRPLEFRTHLEEPYGLLWPISPFTLSGMTRELERDPARPSAVDLVSIEQPWSSDPVQTTTLCGTIRYLGAEEIEAAGVKWRAHKYSLQVPLHPQFLLWTSESGLLLAFTVEHEHTNWTEEGLRLTRFHGWQRFGTRD
jgi:hypothetical protein